MMTDTPEPCQAEKCSEQRTESVLGRLSGRGMCPGGFVGSKEERIGVGWTVGAVKGCGREEGVRGAAEALVRLRFRRARCLVSACAA